MKTKAVSSFADTCSMLEEIVAFNKKKKVPCAIVFTENNAVEVKTAK